MNNGDDYVRGLLEARHLYAQAWADVTGKPLEEIEFTTERLREEIRSLQAEARAEALEEAARLVNKRAKEWSRAWHEADGYRERSIANEVASDLEDVETEVRALAQGQS